MTFDVVAIYLVWFTGLCWYAGKYVNTDETDNFTSETHFF